jgi:hypothetical protein
MLRYASLLLLPAALCLINPDPAHAFWRADRDGRPMNIAGDYVNRSNGGRCSVYPQGRGFVFVNENGSKARFVFTGPRRLEMVSGQWDPSVVVTVVPRRGGPVLRFDSPNAATGYWVPAD